ncbi:hypothetical protein OKW21_004697 [Catalinimonas alkaloidigena]|uniref:hypothetical protein n=1 Tax=Catalinimonas alkaloidigena TaxID=1075417 RepID=UPI002404D386|nr:hypothetical protein [Catalinimonas alkaloidigena]MDF9799434.1 hypothetical protein [Catalinimonas alkaloidigena]
MKKNSILYISMVLTGLMLFSTACEDEELNPYVEPLPGVHAFGQFAADSPTNFIIEQTGEDLNINLQWISVDRELEVEKIDVFVLFNESYRDVDNNPLVAEHGGDEGIFYTTIEGGELPANRENTTISISQEDVLNLYNGTTYDYDEDGTAEDVFDNDFKPSRSNDAPFISGDNFSIRWVLYTTDGLVFDSWSPSVCTELPGANCSVDWILECGQVIKEPAQDYTITFNDSYGDGWNGAAISVIVDGEATEYTLADGSTGTEVVTVPEGTTSLSFEFISGDYDSEVSYSIVTEKGNSIAAGGPSPSVGAITLDLCVENE